MTRVNIIPVEQLQDQHLVAEYREIIMVARALERTLKSKGGLNNNKISKRYTLNSGHVYFFFDKGLFLAKRYDLLVEEMKKRGMNPDPSRRFPLESFPPHLQNDYFPTDSEQQINRERILLRISQKPNWYRKSAYVE
jgi:deoxyribonuclease (pyrimidine dimer)